MDMDLKEENSDQIDIIVGDSCGNVIHVAVFPQEEESKF